MDTDAAVGTTGVLGTSLHSAGDLDASAGGTAALGGPAGARAVSSLDPVGKHAGRSDAPRSAPAILRGVPKPASDPVEGVSGRQSPAGPISRTALEEAAHALLAGPDSRMTVSIVPDAVSGGRCLPEGPDEGYAPTWDDAGRAAAELHARYACAGAVAKHIAFGEWIHVRGVDADLFDRAVDRLGSGSGMMRAAAERDVLADTERMLRANWARVVRLATALEERKTLDADAVHRLLWTTP